MNKYKFGVLFLCTLLAVGRGHLCSATTTSAQSRLNSALRQALEGGKHAQLAMLLKQGANPNVKMDSDGRTLLMQASAWGVEDEVVLLLKFSARVNTQDADGNTALMYAVQKGRDDNLPALLARHANVNLRNKEGMTAMAMAKTRLADNTTTSFLHIKAGERRKVWRQIVHLLRQADKKPLSEKFCK